MSEKHTAAQAQDKQRLPERVIDTLWQAAGLSTYHPNGHQLEKLYDFAHKVTDEVLARLPAAPVAAQPQEPSSDLDILRRIAERGLKLAQRENHSFIDLFQHMLDEIARCKAPVAQPQEAGQARDRLEAAMADVLTSHTQLSTDVIDELAPILAAQPAPAVPDEVLRAVERMSTPLHESRLSGVTAQEDARCIKVIANFIRSLAAAQSTSSASDAKDINYASPECCKGLAPVNECFCAKQDYIATTSAPAIAAKDADLVRDVGALTDKKIAAAARALSDRYADICNVNKDDNWMIYGADCIEDARTVLAALAAQP